MVRKELFYEYANIPPASEALKCLCNRLKMRTHEERIGGALVASTKDGSLIARLSTETMARGGLKVVVKIRVTTDDDMTAVISCFGEPRKEQALAPTTQNFAEIIIKTKFRGNLEQFIQTVCDKLGIEQEQFGSYR
ncbi:MAG: hypothetical protein ACFFDP_11765, partial [Promethearchaeota archaeon]